ncbi:CcdC protein domain-containing protein [Streptomyces sp. AK02-01A]|uniref:CcdC protein domain-containing protein n=1 Tax=Streptomyces sp. AK02-01A TaxID=3028648 RepID=UPI0029AC9233|nr:CcdC protein domain-containing protein [Streptomyces sp. AK02-01A]MDX3851967.1 DUF1453 family protein [Streptomyces sp. AK02-01A]
MSSFIDVLLIAGVVALVVVRQFRPQRITVEGRGLLVVPAVLVFLALREPGLLDAHERTVSVLLLGAELAVGLLLGAGWARTSRIWTAEDGSVWARGTKATAAVWIGGLAARAALMGIGALAGVHQGTGALLLALAASVLVRGGMLGWRVRADRPSSAGDAALAWKDRV